MPTQRSQKKVDDALEHMDAVIVPVHPIDAPLRSAVTYKLGGKEMSKLEATIRYISLFNQTGHPGVSTPAMTTTDDDRSVSTCASSCKQLVGRINSDWHLLMLARQLETVLSIKIDYDSISDGQKHKVVSGRHLVSEEEEIS